MAKDMVILICDDDPVVHESIGIYLDTENYKHVSAFDGEEALQLFNTDKPDLILLDIMLPKRSGIDVCREIRHTSSVPIIMLTAKGEEIDRVLGLEMGADDYVVKPFSPREVVARIKAVMRRLENQHDDDVSRILRFGQLEINLAQYQIRIDGENIQFSPKEVEILYLLASNPGHVFSRADILQQVWGFEYFGDTRTVDTHIKRIRQKLPVSNKYGVHTVYGVGYKFEAQNN